MLRGAERECPDCGTLTVFLPVDDALPRRTGEEWVCTACDGALLIPCLVGDLAA